MKKIMLVMSASFLLIACSKSFDSSLNKFEKDGGTNYKVIDTPYINKLDTPYLEMKVIDTPYKSLNIDTPYKSYRIDTPYKSYKVIDTPYKH